MTSGSPEPISRPFLVVRVTNVGDGDGYGVRVAAADADSIQLAGRTISGADSFATALRNGECVEVGVPIKSDREHKTGSFMQILPFSCRTT